MDEFLAEAAERTNERTRCEGTDDEVRDLLAREIERATSRRALVWRRGPTRAPGFSTYTKRVLVDPTVDRFEFEHREDLYGRLTLWHSVVLTLAGPCATLEVGGVRFGDDKLDHFLANGYDYFRDAARHGAEVALRRGTRTERTFYGLLTSKTFSYADLRANHDGYHFFADLLGPDSVVGRDERGCVAARRAFDWRVWVNPEWDELVNPPVYTHLVEKGVLRTLERDRDAICAARARWDLGGWREAALGTLPSPDYVVGPAPGRRDPWQLEALCDPARETPLTTSSPRPREEVRALRR